MQALIDAVREKLATRHQNLAKQHIARRDFWRWQIERPWPELIPAWTPWAGLLLFCLVVAWRYWP